MSYFCNGAWLNTLFFEEPSHNDSLTTPNPHNNYKLSESLEHVLGELSVDSRQRNSNQYLKGKHSRSRNERTSDTFKSEDFSDTSNNQRKSDKEKKIYSVSDFLDSSGCARPNSNILIFLTNLYQIKSFNGLLKRISTIKNRKLAFLREFFKPRNLNLARGKIYGLVFDFENQGRGFEEMRAIIELKFETLRAYIGFKDAQAKIDKVFEEGINEKVDWQTCDRAVLLIEQIVQDVLQVLRNGTMSKAVRLIDKQITISMLARILVIYWIINWLKKCSRSGPSDPGGYMSWKFNRFYKAL